MGTERDGQKGGLGRGCKALYLRAGRRRPGWGAPGSPAQARRRSGRSTGGGLAGGGGGNPPPTRNCLLVNGGVGAGERRTRSDPQTLLESSQLHLPPSDSAHHCLCPQLHPKLCPTSRSRPLPKPLSLLGNPSPGVAGWGGVGGAGGVDWSMSPSGGPWTLSSLVGVSCEGRLGETR